MQIPQKFSKDDTKFVYNLTKFKNRKAFLSAEHRRYADLWADEEI